jgi:hypothetical protein
MSENNVVEKKVVESERKLSIKEICDEFDLSPVYVRRSLLKGKLNGEKVQIMNNTEKWVVPLSEVERWRKTRSNSGARKDGRNKFTIYCTPSEYKKLRKVLGDNGLSLPLSRSNPPKTS